MAQIKVGDVVGRKSYGCDILFRVCNIEGNTAHIKGIDMRIMATSPLEDLEIISTRMVNEYRIETIRKVNEQVTRILNRRALEKERMLTRGTVDPSDFFERPGRILHVDGDKEYLEICLNTYKQLSIQAEGYMVDEEKQPMEVVRLLREVKPDILVLTGHDGLLKGKRDFGRVDNYHNSRYFIEAVKKAREVVPGLDDLVIFAGACQSFYEGIMAAGANFASSPHRILIHALDPVLIMEKVAFTPISQTISIQDVLTNTMTGIQGVGGIETRGKFRLGLPKSPYV